MIWDPVKQFACLCKDGFVGELCEKCTPDMNVLFIINKTLKNISSITPPPPRLAAEVISMRRYIGK